MDKIMFWRLVGAFVNVAVLTRVVQWLLKNRIRNPRPRAFSVLVLVLLIELIGIFYLYKDMTLTLHIILFYYTPFLLMWFLKDIFYASGRQKGKASTKI